MWHKVATIPIIFLPRSNNLSVLACEPDLGMAAEVSATKEMVMAIGASALLGCCMGGG